MSTRGGYSGRQRKDPLRIEHDGGKVTFVERRIIAEIKEATEASEEDIEITLQECGGDVNEATEKLIASPFKVVKRKKDDRRRTERGSGRPGNANFRGSEAASNRGPRQPRDVRGGPAGAQNGLRTERARGGGRGASRAGGGRQRPSAAEGRKTQEAYPNGVHEKEADAREAAGPADEVLERSETSSAAAKPVAPAPPRKTGYADALCRGIGLNQAQRTPPAASVPPAGPPPAVPAPAVPSSAGPPPSGTPPPGSLPEPPRDSAAVTSSASAPAPGASPPEQISQPAGNTRQDVSSNIAVPEEALETSPAEPLEELKPDLEATIPQSHSEPPIPSEAKPWGEARPADSRFAQMLTVEELAVPIQRPNFGDLSSNPEHLESGGLPAYPAPAVDLSLETPPSFESSGINLKFGSFSGVDDFSHSAEESTTPGLDHSVVTGDSANLDVEQAEPAPNEQTSVDAVVEPPLDSIASEKFEEAHERSEDLFVTSQPTSAPHSTPSQPVPEAESDPIIKPGLDTSGTENVSSIAIQDLYAPQPAVEDVPVPMETKADASTQVAEPHQPDATDRISEPSYTSTGVQHSSYNPAVSMQPQPSTIPGYPKAVEKPNLQPNQFVDLSDKPPAERKPVQPGYPSENQVAAVHHPRPTRHQLLQEQRPAFDTTQHAPNTTPSLPYQRQESKQDHTPAHPAHTPQQRFVSQVSAAAQTDANAVAIGNQAAQSNAAVATPSSGAPSGVANIPQPPAVYNPPVMHNHGMHFPPFPSPQYMPSYQSFPMFHGNLSANYPGYAYPYAAESTGLPTHGPPGAAPPKFAYQAGVGGSSGNQSYANYAAASNVYGLAAVNPGYDGSGGMTPGYNYPKEKDNMPQPAQQHSGYAPGMATQIRGNEFYGPNPNQAYNQQGYRNQNFPQNYAPLGTPGYGAPHQFVNGQQNNFRGLH